MKKILSIQVGAMGRLGWGSKKKLPEKKLISNLYKNF
jgi:hypothetical protein